MDGTASFYMDICHLFCLSSRRVAMQIGIPSVKKVSVQTLYVE